MSTSKPLVRVFSGADAAELINVSTGAWVSYDMGSSEVSDTPYTAGVYAKDALATDITFDSFHGNEWKFILDGEWHMIQNGEMLVAKKGDVVFLPKSLSNPFTAFFVTNRGPKTPVPMQK